MGEGDDDVCEEEKGVMCGDKRENNGDVVGEMSCVVDITQITTFDTLPH